MTRHYFHENIGALQQAVEAIPSISEVGEVSEGEVAQPDASRMFNRIQPQPAQYALPRPPPLTLPPPATAPEDAPEAPVEVPTSPEGRVSTGAARMLGVHRRTLDYYIKVGYLDRVYGGTQRLADRLRR